MRKDTTTSQRVRIAMNKISTATPGPGTYQAPSDFGNYKEFARTQTRGKNPGQGSDWNYSSLSPQKFGSDMSLESPLAAPRPVSQLQPMNGTMRAAKRLVKRISPSQDFTSAGYRAPQRLRTLNGFR